MAKPEKSSRDKGLQERIVFLTDADQRQRLQEHSELTGAPIATILRRAVDMYLQSVKSSKK
jgi:predicted DNA-binding protein